MTLNCIFGEAPTKGSVECLFMATQTGSTCQIPLMRFLKSIHIQLPYLMSYNYKPFVSSFRAVSMDFPNSLSLSLSRRPSLSSIVSSRSSRLHPLSVKSQYLSTSASRLSYAYEFVLAFPTVNPMSCSSNLDGLRDEWKVAIQLLFSGRFLPGFLCNSCAIKIVT